MESYQKISTLARLTELKHFSENLKMFNERLESANSEILHSQMDKYEDIRNILTTPAKDLNEKYKNLVDEVFFQKNLDKTLYEMIEYPIRQEEKNGSWKCLFSFIGDSDKVNGFIAYEVVGNLYINEIKMFSFDLNHSIPLMRDLESLLKDFIERYEWIHWAAFERNEIGNKIYQRTIQKYNGISFKRQGGVETSIDYFIPGTKPLPKSILDLAETK